jgi:hypothetical protein
MGFLMKNTILTIILNFLMTFLNAQSTYEYLRVNPLDEVATSLIDDQSNNIYFPVINYQNALIIKLDPNGLLLDSVQIFNPSGSCILSELIRVNDSQLVALGEWSDDSTSQLWFTKFDNNLNQLDDKKINSNGFPVYEFRSIINQTGNIVFIANYTKSQSSIDVCIYEITQDGILVKTRFFNSTFINFGYSLLEDVSTFSYKIFSYLPLDLKTMCFLNILDTNFNVTDTRSMYEYIDGNNSARWINDSTYLLTGERYTSFDKETDLGIIKVNKVDSVIASTYFGKPDTVDLPGLYMNLDYITPDKIFFCATTNSYSWPFQYEPSWIMVNILDPDLNLTIQQYYGGDAFYLVNSVLVTQDSGCVLACSRFDYLSQNNEYDVYILKVNKDGLLVSTPEYTIINKNACYLYPNPGNDLLRINSLKNDLTFQLFDLKGRLLTPVQLRTGSNVISVADFPPGIYLYSITNRKGHTIQTGKWMRQ